MSVYSPVRIHTPQLDKKKKNGKQDRLRFNYYARFEVASGISGSRSLRYLSFLCSSSGSHIVAQSKIKFHKRRKNVLLFFSAKLKGVGKKGTPINHLFEKN